LSEQLTERQNKILDYIRYVTRVRSYPPSVREIGEAVGLSSSSTVHNHLNQLERRGLIKRDPSKSRTVQLVQDVAVDTQRRNAISVPIVGNVAAGAPILAEQNIEDHLLLSPELAQEGFFLLRVRGDSMINACILDGDLVLVKPQQEAPNGTIVVAAQPLLCEAMSKVEAIDYGARSAQRSPGSARKNLRISNSIASGRSAQDLPGTAPRGNVNRPNWRWRQRIRGSAELSSSSAVRSRWPWSMNGTARKGTPAKSSAASPQPALPQSMTATYLSGFGLTMTLVACESPWRTRLGNGR